MNIFTDPRSPWRLPCRWLYPANWCADGFREQLQFIQRHPELRGDDNLLTDNAGKRVWKIRLPREAGSATVAYKYCQGKTPWRYLVDLSHPAREWRNYQVLYHLGIPAAEVLAYGESRRGWKLEDSFIVTRFIEGTRDGTDFMPDGPRRNDLALRRRFCAMIAPHAAALHRNNFFHKALHPRNVLYRGDTPETMEIFFIDVARCRIRFPWRMKYAILFDLYTPLRDLKLPAEESRAFIAKYLENYPECPLSAAEIEHALRAYRRHGNRFDVIGDAAPESGE